MNAILAIPLELRLLCLFVAGLALGSLLNLAIYRLAFAPRPISPWSAPPRGAPPRSGLDRLPIYGWLRLRREAGIHGRGFWIRPALLELATAIALPLLYWWETESLGLLGPECARLLRIGIILPPPQPLAEVLHAQFVCHALLIALMAVATFIDIDEKTIPDAITVPGTLLGLLLVALMPWSLLPVVDMRMPAALPAPPVFTLGFLKLTSPLQWPANLDGTFGLLVGLMCYWLWCFALLPRPWRTRHGYGRAARILWARASRAAFTVWTITALIAGTALVLLAWRNGGDSWQAVLSSLVGLAVGGGLIWTVRIVGKAALHKEAMGFGDVTLMCMIGVYLGWQSCLMIFFLAPFAGLVIGVLNFVLRSDNEIPYGPFLCLAALVVIIYWGSLWDWAEEIFMLGWFVPGVMLVCMLLMGLMLSVWRMISDRLFVQED